MLNVKKGMLIKIIREEVHRKINETSRLPDELDSGDLIAFADAWVGLGAAVQEQVKQVLDLGPSAEVNHSAIEVALERLQGFSEDIDYALQEFLADGREEQEEFVDPMDHPSRFGPDDWRT